jgi:hypothetical protein
MDVLIPVCTESETDRVGHLFRSLSIPGKEAPGRRRELPFHLGQVIGSLLERHLRGIPGIEAQRDHLEIFAGAKVDLVENIRHRVEERSTDPGTAEVIQCEDGGFVDQRAQGDIPAIFIFEDAIQVYLRAQLLINPDSPGRRILSPHPEGQPESRNEYEF